LLEAGVALALVAFLGTRLVPWVLYRVARTQSRELFLLTIVTIALGTAAAGHYAGLSLALGAFLAGLVISESEFDVQVIAEIIPLRDLFATLFFVSLGMLIQPDVVLDNPLALAIAVSLLVGGKAIIASIGFLVARINPLVAVSAGFLAAQIGEFSFVLAGSGLESGIIDSSQYALVIAIALISILLSPGVSSAAPAVGDLVARLPFVRDSELEELGDAEDAGGLRRHVIVCGYGRVGQVLCAALERRGVPYLVIEINAGIVRDIREQGARAIYGDAGRVNVLEHANVQHAQALAITVPDMVAASAATRLARSLNSGIAIITRTGGAGEMFTLKSDGASEVVQPEFEAGLEFTRYVLRRLGVSARELEIVTSRRRAQFYDQAEGGSVYTDEL
jgi:CPA2 family monovalent cation:H+ antiporter-2